MISLPVTSTTRASPGIETFAPTATIVPSRINTVPFAMAGPTAVRTVAPRRAIVCAAPPEGTNAPDAITTIVQAKVLKTLGIRRLG